MPANFEEQRFVNWPAFAGVAVAINDKTHCIVRNFAFIK